MFITGKQFHFNLTKNYYINDKTLLILSRSPSLIILKNFFFLGGVRFVCKVWKEGVGEVLLLKAKLAPYVFINKHTSLVFLFISLFFTDTFANCSK